MPMRLSCQSSQATQLSRRARTSVGLQLVRHRPTNCGTILDVFSLQPGLVAPCRKPRDSEVPRAKAQYRDLPSSEHPLDHIMLALLIFHMNTDSNGSWLARRQDRRTRTSPLPRLPESDRLARIVENVRQGLQIISDEREEDRSPSSSGYSVPRCPHPSTRDESGCRSSRAGRWTPAGRSSTPDRRSTADRKEAPASCALRTASVRTRRNVALT